jgi:NAD(P)-dependent dehydrogenase (short-subunit alcohol dehydrogenase family)
VTLKPLTLLAVYTASKAAVNAFSECLALELAPFNVRVSVVLPGRAPETSFGSNAQARVIIPEEYAELAKGVFAELTKPTEITRSIDVSEAVWRAATDPTAPLHIAAGEDAVALM